jgi:hypothetical protein
MRSYLRATRGTRALRPVLALERILVALERELLEATDEEILDAAKDLGMNPAMRGSAAFFGLKYSYALHALGADGMRAPPRDADSPERSIVKPRQPKDEPPTGL